MGESNFSSIERASENWNVADGFTKLKILKQLVETDQLVRIAIYGSESISLENFQVPEEYKISLRIEAIRRLIDVLKELIENSHFACDKSSKEVLEKLEERIETVEFILPPITKQEHDQRTGRQTTRINEKHFMICLDELRSIKKEIPYPLNENSLIFPRGEEYDLDKIKEDFIFDG